MKIWQTWLIIGLVAVIISGCASSAAKLRRAEKLIKKAEELGAKWHVDTVIQEIKVPVPEIHVKEVHHAPILDTVTIEKERLKIKVVRLPGDSIFVEGKCEADTIRIKQTVTINKTIKAKGYSLWQLIILALVAVVFGYGIRAFIRR